jgi:hypothetical protein
MKWLRALSWLALLVLPVAASAQTPGIIQGTVRDSSNARPLASANVSLVGTRFAVATNEQGQYILRNVPAGTYTVRAQRIGYALRTSR